MTSNNIQLNNTQNSNTIRQYGLILSRINNFIGWNTKQKLKHWSVIAIICSDSDILYKDVFVILQPVIWNRRNLIISMFNDRYI